MPGENIRQTYLKQGFNEEQSSLLASMSMQIDSLKDRIDKVMREDGVTDIRTEDMIVKLQRKAVEVQNANNGSSAK